MATAAGVGRTAIQKLERPATVYTKVQPLHRVVAGILGWTAASVDLVLAGGDPVMADQSPSASPAPAQSAGRPDAPNLPADLPERALLALLGGRVVDAEVIDLAPDDPDAVAVLVLKRGASTTVTTEQMREDLKRWSRLQRAARRIFTEEQPNQ
jgi:hypothetical protein